MFKYEKVKINGFMGTGYSYVSQVFGLDRLLKEVVDLMKEKYDEDKVHSLTRTYEFKSLRRVGEVGKVVTIKVSEDEVLVDFEDSGNKELGLVTHDSIINIEDKPNLEFDVYEYNTPR